MILFVAKVRFDTSEKESSGVSFFDDDCGDFHEPVIKKCQHRPTVRPSRLAVLESPLAASV